MAEYFDIFDANMRPVAPFRMERDEVHRKGEWHQTFHCWVVRRDPSGNKILLQLRGADVFDHPGTFDISAAGHLQSGEAPLDGARELEEELGIAVDPAALCYAGVIKQATDNGGYRNREFCHTYFYETPCRLGDYRPQQSEVDGLFEMDVAEGLRLFSGAQDKTQAEGIVREGSAYVPSRRAIALADMCGLHDRHTVTRYYLKVLMLADLFLRGHRPLAI